MRPFSETTRLVAEEALLRSRQGGGGGGGGVTQANTFYISPSGNDSNNGSIGSPCLTYNHLATQIGAAATASQPYAIVAEPGSYTQNLALQPFISLLGAAGASLPVFTGTHTLGGRWTLTPAALAWVDGCDIEGTLTTDFGATGQNNGYLYLANSLVGASIVASDSTLQLNHIVIQSTQTVSGSDSYSHVNVWFFGGNLLGGHDDYHWSDATYNTCNVRAFGGKFDYPASGSTWTNCGGWFAYTVFGTAAHLWVARSTPSTACSRKT